MIDQRLIYQICGRAIASQGATPRVAPVVDEQNITPDVNSCVAVYTLVSEESVLAIGSRAVFKTWQIELRCLSYDLLNRVDEQLVIELNAEPRVLVVNSAFDVAEDETTTKTIFRRQRTIELEPA